MSGLRYGLIQRAIIAEAATLIERAELKWRVADTLGRVPPAARLAGGPWDEALLPDSYVRSFDRAIRALRDRADITLAEWVPTSFDEFCDAYKFKTNSTFVRELRAALLPKMEPLLSKLGKEVISLEDTESRFVRELEPTMLAPHASSWASLRPRVLASLSPSRSPDWVDAALAVSVAGRRLFESRLHPLHGVPFGDAVAMVERAAVTPTEKALASDLRSFYERAIPAKVRSRGDLKNDLYAFLDVHRHGTASYKDGFLDELHKAAPKLVESLPGHQPAQRAKGEWWESSRPTYSQRLAELLDRIALRSFTKVSATSQAVARAA